VGVREQVALSRFIGDSRGNEKNRLRSAGCDVDRLHTRYGWEVNILQILVILVGRGFGEILSGFLIVADLIRDLEMPLVESSFPLFPHPGFLFGRLPRKSQVDTISRSLAPSLLLLTSLHSHVRQCGHKGCSVAA
jgi:hypothetical protein